MASLRSIQRQAASSPVRSLAFALLVLLAWTSVAHADLGWRVSRPATVGDVGRHASLALDGKGQPRIAFFDSGTHQLLYAERDAGQWTIAIADSTLELGGALSLALDGLGRPHVAYYNQNRGQLEHAFRSGGAWMREPVDTAVDAGSFLSLALTGAGQPRIGYYDATNRDLRYAAWVEDHWEIETADAAGVVGSHVSLALDGAGRPHMAYHDAGSGDLKYVTKNAGVWKEEVVDSAGTVGLYTAIRVDGSGTVHIASYDQTLKRLRYAFGSATSWTLETVEDDAGTHVSMRLDSEGQPHLSYRVGVTGGNGDLGYAVRDRSTWKTEKPDTSGDVGLHSSIALGRGARPRIAYYDGSEGDLLYAELLPLRLVLNEFLVRPRPGRAEFFELYNGTPDTVDWGYSQISVTRYDGGSTHVHVVPADTYRAPGAFYADSAFATQNFFFDEGGVITVYDSSGSILEQVGYGVAGGAPISCPLLVPPGGAPPPGFATWQPVELSSMVTTTDPETLLTSTERIFDGGDTGDDAQDFSLGAPTFATTNVVAAPDLGNGTRLNGVYVFPDNHDGNPVNESVQLVNPTGGIREAGTVYLSDGYLLQPLFPTGTQLPMEPGQEYLAVEGVNGEFSFELEENDRLDLYELRTEGLVRVDQLGWYRIPTYFPDSAIVRVPDGVGPASGWDWNTSGGDVHLFYQSNGPFAPPLSSTPVEPAPWKSRLDGPRPHPARGALAFTFEVEGASGSSAAVEVALYDVRGRRVARPIAGRFEAGPHRVLWSPGAAGAWPLRAGVYWMSLSVAGRTAGEAKRVVWIP